MGDYNRPLYSSVRVNSIHTRCQIKNDQPGLHDFSVNFAPISLDFFKGHVLIKS